MKELIGKECTIVFNFKPFEWPIQGFPAWATVEAVDMPMVKLVARHTGKEIWVNAAIIQTIKVSA